MARSEFSKKTKLAAWNRAKGHCEKCTVKITGANMPPNYDHVLPDALGGNNTLENCEVLCKTCHSLKTTKEDVPRISKTRRGFEKHIRVRKKTSRPMPGTKESGLRKRMDGTVERR